MKLITFSTTAHPLPRIGVMRGKDIVDIESAAAHAGMRLEFDPMDMISLIESGEAGLDQVKALLKIHQSGTPEPVETQIHAPIPRPRKNVVCVGWNYVEHFAEGELVRKSGQEIPEHPTFFTKSPTAVNGPFGDISCDPALHGKFDWEVELGVIIGREGKTIQEAAAMDYVFGYTVINDISVRNAQRAHGGQWFKGKSFDGTCPMGPYLVTSDEIDPCDLQLICRINDVMKQNASTKQMHFNIPRIISELSWGMTLEPGDVISTGTPPGVGFARTPPEFLQPGDVVETEIVGLGVMRNRMV
jgi:2-keto-4-pentenoate hydratase/2-oxohepta-3-ene-1,7-dioic acid hydratase in catechol pathway